jgi:hypothetical protein
VLADARSWIAAVTVVVAVVAATVVILLLLQAPTALAVSAMGVIAVALWPIAISATGALRRRQHLARPLPPVNDLELRDLADELDGLADPRPAYQLQAIRQKRDGLVAVLGRRMDAGELTYARYESAAQQVFLAVISNLREIAIARRSISAIDTEYVNARLAELGADDTPDARAESSSLEDRRALATTQEAKISYLLAQNESAMTLLDRTSTALADAPIGLTPQATEAALAALRELADRAGRYAM